MSNQKIKIVIDADGKKYHTEIDKVTGKTKQLERQTQLTASRLNHMAGTIKLVAGAMAAAAATTTASRWLDVNRRFESLEATLLTVSDSAEEAQLSLDFLENFATTTPFQLDQVTDSFIKLKAMGLEPSAEAFTAYGNIASGMGKSLNQLIEAVADAAVGEFERLKEFGIKTRSQGDKVSFTFKGITTTIGKNSQEIVQYLQNIGNVDFADAMTRQMDTLDGKISNLGDQIDRLFRNTGGEDLVKDIISSFTDGLDRINTILESGKGNEKADLKKEFQDLASEHYDAEQELARLYKLKPNWLNTSKDIKNKIIEQTQKVEELWQLIEAVDLRIKKLDKQDQDTIEANNQTKQQELDLKKQQQAAEQLAQTLAKLKESQQYSPDNQYVKQIDDLQKKWQSIVDLATTAQMTTDDNYLSAHRQYTQQLSDLTTRHNEFELQKYHEMQTKKLQATHTFASGATLALQEYHEQANNLSGAYKDVVLSGFSAMEDAIVRFAMTGKMSFKDMTNSIVADLMRIAIRKQIVAPLANMLFGSFTATNPATYGATGRSLAMPAGPLQQTSVFHGGGIVGDISPRTRAINPEIFSTAGRYHAGGVIGLKNNEVPAVLERGEGVFTRQQMQHLSPVNNNPKVSVRVYNNSNTQVTTKESQNNDGSTNIDVIIDDIDNALGERISLGTGGLFNAIESRKG
jgi:lambda family phage tail tape measure protein